LADLGSADARTRQAGLLDQRRRTQRTRIAKDATRRLVAQRLTGLALNPRPPHPFDDGVGGIGLQAKLGTEDHRIIEVAGVVAEAQLVALAHLHLAAAIENLDLAHELTD